MTNMTGAFPSFFNHHNGNTVSPSSSTNPNPHHHYNQSNNILINNKIRDVFPDGGNGILGSSNLHSHQRANHLNDDMTRSFGLLNLGLGNAFEEPDSEICNILGGFDETEEIEENSFTILRQKSTTPTFIRFASFEGITDNAVAVDETDLRSSETSSPLRRYRNGSTPPPAAAVIGGKDQSQKGVGAPNGKKSNPNSPITALGGNNRSYSIKELYDQLQHVPVKTEETEGRSTPPGSFSFRERSPQTVNRARSRKSPANELHKSSTKTAPFDMPKLNVYPVPSTSSSTTNGKHSLGTSPTSSSSSSSAGPIPLVTPPLSGDWLQSNQRKEQQIQLQRNLHQLSALFNNNNASFFHFPIEESIPPSPPQSGFLQQNHSSLPHLPHSYHQSPFSFGTVTQQAPRGGLPLHTNGGSAGLRPSLPPQQHPPPQHYNSQKYGGYVYSFSAPPASSYMNGSKPGIESTFSSSLYSPSTSSLQSNNQNMEPYANEMVDSLLGPSTTPQPMITPPIPTLSSQTIGAPSNPEQQPISPSQPRFNKLSPVQTRRQPQQTQQRGSSNNNSPLVGTPNTSFKQNNNSPRSSHHGSPNNSPVMPRRNSMGTGAPPAISVTFAPSSSSASTASNSAQAVPTATAPQPIPAPNDSLLHPNSNNKRNELSLSPTTKLKFKAFFRQFKLKEKEGFLSAKQFAFSSLSLLPEKIHWKVYLQMADLAKRENLLREAHRYYKKVNKLQPYASQGWLEHAKMEEECGDLERCRRILANGLAYCTYNENLMVKAIKLEERIGNIAGARLFLARLKNVSIDQTWRTILEGGLLEARVGNIVVARKVFKYLMKNVPWYGPIYYEAFRFEEKCEEYQRAIEIVERGLKENPHYGPLWFSALRLYEKTSSVDLSKTRETVERAKQAISKELTWKLYFEAAQIEDRAGNLELSRKAYVQSVVHCQENLLWKVWLGGARTELNNNNLAIARKLLKRSFEEVPLKMRAMVLLECSRLEEYAGHIDRARKILKKARIEAKHEWKVFLESVLLEMRSNNIHAAIQEAQEALEVHRGTGRLWAVLIQLKQIEGEEQQLLVFQEALNEVPKSGEVWCEGARIALNKNNFTEARKFLDFAIQFTPQYGDSFIEYMRLELLEKGPNTDTSRLEQLCINADPNYGSMWLYCKRHPLDSTRQVLRAARQTLLEELELMDGAAFFDVGLSANGGREPSDLLSPRGSRRRGLLSLNQVCQHIHELTDEERRRAIYGSDQIKP